MKTRILTTTTILLSILVTSCTQGLKNKEQDINYKEVIQPEWTKNASIYEVNIRQFTPEGTFSAFAEHLPRLKDLGIDILWLMPIHPIGEKNRKGTLGSYYSVKDYYDVNPEFGNKEDFKDLISKAHQLDMYVILDWVANHSAWDNKLINEHPDWYTKDNKGNIVSPVDDWADVADFNFDVPEMQDYMIGALKYWVEEFDIDGYRCDVAGMVPIEFWNRTRHELDKIKPVFMLAEAEEPDLHKYAFDMTYAWSMHFTWNEIVEGKKTVDALTQLLKEEKIKYKASDYRMQFTSNHDENTWKGTVYERLGKATKTFAVLSFTIPGMPLIYNGQEACLEKRLLFFDKDSIDWNQDCTMEGLYSTLLALKKENPALWNGDWGGKMERIKTTADDKVFAFSRIKDKHRVVTILNLTNEQVAFELTEPIEKNDLSEIFTGEEIQNSYSLEAWEYKVFKR